jgi:hypothetical protein
VAFLPLHRHSETANDRYGHVKSRGVRSDFSVADEIEKRDRLKKWG